jgi:hydrogenase expression/formation protein HypD
VEIQYNRAVKENGNKLAQRYMNEVFEPCDTYWRGFGMIPASGLALRLKYLKYDAEKIFDQVVEETEDDGTCICGEILRGLKVPVDCPLFGRVCVPDKPVGACMVSSEGACNTWYKYKRYE